MSSFAEEIAALSSAEEFFAYFKLPFDPRVMAASRLHILKRFHDNLAGIGGLEIRGDGVKRDIYRAELARAYESFVTGSALTERVFPGLMRMKGAFVALSAVRLPRSQQQSCAEEPKPASGMDPA